MSHNTKLPPPLESALKETSRAFYLSLSLLPKGPRLPISTAYLLARSADSIADDPSLSPRVKFGFLGLLRDAVHHQRPVCPPALQTLYLSDPREKRLLELLPSALELFAQLPRTLRELVAEVVTTLIDGMLWDQDLFECERSEQGLSSEALERYTYLVAGCVGPFWSRTLCEFDHRLAALAEPEQLEIATEFGRALQYVNILRDIPEDQAKGRYYLPALEGAHFEKRFQEVGQRCLAALTSGSRYPTWFRPTQLRERACALLPLILGLRTLELIFTDGKPRQGRRVKVKRREVWLWLAATAAFGWCDQLLEFTLHYLNTRARRSLEMYESGAQ